MSTKLWYLILAWGRGVQSSNYLDVEDDQENEWDDVSKHSVGSNEINVIVKWVFPQTCRFDCVPESKGHNIFHSNAKLQPIKASWGKFWYVFKKALTLSSCPFLLGGLLGRLASTRSASPFSGWREMCGFVCTRLESGSTVVCRWQCRHSRKWP